MKYLNAEVNYSMEDLIDNKDPKGKKIMAYDSNSKEIVGVEGIGKWTGGVTEGIHNIINVYNPETHKEYKASIRSKDEDLWSGFLSEYNKKFPYTLGRMPREWEKIKCHEEKRDDIIRFIKVNIEKYGLAICLSGGRLVDAEPNIKGRYTLLKIGVSFLHGKLSRFYKIRDNDKSKEYWTFSGNSTLSDDCMDASNNLFTNVRIHRNCPIFTESIEIENVTLQHKVYEECIREVDELIHFYLKDSGIVYREDGEIRLFQNRRIRYYSNEEYTKKCNEFNEKTDRLKEKYNLLNSNTDFESVLAEAVSKLEGKKGVFHANMECCEETVYSFDKEIIEEYVWSWFNTNIDYVTDEEEC